MSKKTFNPNTRSRRKKHGFLTRKKTLNGAKIILRRLRKGRKRLAVS